MSATKLTRQLDLRTGRTVWQAYRAPVVETPPLTRDARTDVLVVGMGISGAMIAETLAARGRDVLCIDRRGPLLGSTPATTALVQFEIDQPLSRLTRMIGRDRAEAAWRRSRLSLLNLSDRIGELGIKCRLETRPSLYLAGNALDPGGLRGEAEARRLAGLDCTYLPASALRERFGIDRKGAILSRGNLALDPRKLAAGLLLAAKAGGARLHAPVEATTIEDSAEEVTVATKGGPVISARHVVLATGYELADVVPPGKHSIISTWAVATRQQPRSLWPERAFMWEASDPYLYLRATADGRVICGGEDEDFTDEERRDALLPEKTQRIAGKLSRLLPGIDARPQFAWAGSFGTTPTGLPYIGRVPRRPRILSCMGYGGNGITWSRIAAEIIAAELFQETDGDAALFAFGR